MDTAKQNLYDALQAMLKARSSGWGSPNMRKAAALAEKAIKKVDAPRSKRQTKLFDAAKDQWDKDGECEIDDDAVVSTSKEGAYVQAWVWADNPSRQKLSMPGPKVQLRRVANPSARVQLIESRNRKKASG
jgi:hypothetical protein